MRYDRLIVLPCHAVWKAQDANSGSCSSEWFLAPFQIEGHDHLCFIDHIKTCVEELRKHPRALLVISGGSTKSAAGPISEAFSYYQLAQRLYGSEPFFERVVLEEYARDSFENVLFSVCRFHEVSDGYPEFITVVGFEFKRTRFLQYHLKQALGFPEARVDYIGNAPAPGPEIDRDAYFSDLLASEKKHALDHFARDLYGIRDPLYAKRLQRDPFKRHHGYESSNPDMSVFLRILRNGGGGLSDAEIAEQVGVKWK